MKKQPTKKVGRKPVAKKYRATVEIAGKRSIGVGASIREAIADIKNVRNTKTKGVLTIDNLSEDTTRSRVLIAPVLNRLFALSPLMREIALKQVSSLYDL